MVKGVGGGGNCFVSLHPLHTVILILMSGIKCSSRAGREKTIIEFGMTNNTDFYLLESD